MLQVDSGTTRSHPVRTGFESGYGHAVRDYGMNVLVWNKECISRFSNVLQSRMRKHFVGSQLLTRLV